MKEVPHANPDGRGNGFYWATCMAVEQHASVVPLINLEAGVLVFMGWTLGQVSLLGFPHMIKEIEDALKGRHERIPCPARENRRRNSQEAALWEGKIFTKAPFVAVYASSPLS
jgi:hypothetical protein